MLLLPTVANKNNARVNERCNYVPQTLGKGTLRKLVHWKLIYKEDPTVNAKTESKTHILKIVMPK